MKEKFTEKVKRTREAATEEAKRVSEAMTEGVKRVSEAVTEGAKRVSKAVTEAKHWTEETIQTYRPTEEQLEQLRSAVKKGGKAAVDGAAAFTKDILNSKLFKDAAKGAGAGAIIAIPLPLIGPVLGALVGAGVGVYVGTVVEQPALNGPSPSSNEIRIRVTLIKDLAEGLRLLEGLHRDSILTGEEFERLKQMLLEHAKQAPSPKLQG